jgi:hypothetical protein
VTSNDPGDRSTRYRLLAWVGWSVLAAVLLVACFVLWVFTYGIGGSGESAGEKARADLRASVEHSKNKLRDLASDGELTDEEINTATARSKGTDPGTRREGDRISFDHQMHAVTSGAFGSTGMDQCYRFTIAEPLSSTSDVQSTEIPTCDH